MKHIRTRFDKNEISNLPKVSFDGRIFVIDSIGEAEKAVDYLLAQPILGLDTETKPRFKAGSGMNKVALLQVSTPDTCFLFRLNHIGMPSCVVRLLEDNAVIKIGLSWHDDLLQLHRRGEFQPGRFEELQQMAQLVGIKDLSLQKIYANLFGQKISKTQRLTNWEADVLTEGQKVYAATDAWACIQIYNEILRLNETHDYELEVIPEPEPIQPKREIVEPGTDVVSAAKKKISHYRRKKTEPLSKDVNNSPKSPRVNLRKKKAKTSKPKENNNNSENAIS